ncbi:MAG: hypothetical protein U0325_00355 [Polyangiales bacterium]
MVDKGDHHWVSLRQPRTLDHQNSCPAPSARGSLEAIVGAHHLRDRDGFGSPTRAWACAR